MNNITKLGDITMKSLMKLTWENSPRKPEVVML